MTAVAAGLLDIFFASIWQGAIVALSIGIVLGLSGYRLNAATRAASLQIALATIVVLPIVTTLPVFGSHGVFVGGYGILSSGAPHVVPLTGDSWFASRLRLNVVFGDRVVLTLVVAWLVVSTIFFARLGADWLRLMRVMRRSVFLTERDGIRIFRSDDLAIPIAAGIGSPLVIVPTALTLEQNDHFECIVMHELAHVRRRDGLANLCERIAHAVLFFNPFVVVVLRAIAFEREAACDDWAVARSDDLDGYARSLASYALFGAHGHAAALFGASGFARGTIARIQRLEDTRRNGGITLARFALGGLMFIVFLVPLAVTAFTPAIAFESAASSPARVVAVAESCTRGARYAGGPPPEASTPFRPGLVAKVRVNVSPTGKEIGMTFVKSSGNAEFDRAVLSSVTRGTWEPAKVDCKPVAGTYIFLAQTGP